MAYLSIFVMVVLQVVVRTGNGKSVFEGSMELLNDRCGKDAIRKEGLSSK